MTYSPYSSLPMTWVPMITLSPRNGFGHLSLVLAVVGFAFGWVSSTMVLAVLFGMVAVLFGILGCIRLSRGIASNTVGTVVGLALGSGVTVLGLLAMYA